MNVGLVLDERLRSVAVMHVPVEDENPFETVSLPRVMSSARDAAEDTEAHRAATQRVMPRRTHRAKASLVRSRHRVIHAVEHASGGRSRCEPAPFARDSVRIELSAAGSGNSFDGPHIRFVVNEGEIFDRRVAPLEVLNLVEKLGDVAQSACDRAEPTYVLVVAPPGVVAAAVAIGDERGAARARRVTLLNR